MKARVLLVDDETDFVEVLSERIAASGLDVSTAYSGEEAISKIKEHDFDVVILDVRMPGKSGIETLREIKEMKPLTYVIMLTGDSTVENAIEGMKLGAYDYLMKFTKSKELIEKIDKAYAAKKEHEERIQKAEIDNIMKRKGW